MKKLLILSLLLAGCSTTVPVARKFPKIPQELKEQCAPLAQIKTETTKLSEVITVVTDNYTEYHKCNAKVDMWIEWYMKQKKIFESVK
jgi:uncharacterized protein YcfL